MGHSYKLTLGAQPAEDAFTALLTSIEVEEGMDIPSALQIKLPLTRSDSGELGYVADARFQPLATVTLVATAGGAGASGVATGAVGAVSSALGGGAAPTSAFSTVMSFRKKSMSRPASPSRRSRFGRRTPAG